MICDVGNFEFVFPLRLGSGLDKNYKKMEFLCCSVLEDQNRQTMMLQNPVSQMIAEAWQLLHQQG